MEDNLNYVELMLKLEKKEKKLKKRKKVIVQQSQIITDLNAENAQLKEQLASAQKEANKYKKYYMEIQSEFTKFKMQVQLMKCNIEENMVKPAKLGDDEGADIGVEMSDFNAFDKLLSDTNSNKDYNDISNNDNDDDDDSGNDDDDDDDDNCKK